VRSPPATGRFLRLQPVSVIGAFLREDVTMWSGTTQAARSLEWLEPRTPGGSGFVIESAPGHPGLIGLAFPWESTEGFQEIMTRVRHIAPLIAIVRDTGPGGRVRSTGSGGIRIDYRMGPVEVATLRRGLVEMARLGRAAGALDMVALGTPPAWFRPGATKGGQDRAFETYLKRLEWFDFAPNRGMVFSAHQMGTARMGSDPADHVVDERGRVRTDARGAIVPGLYVGDGSLFPTAIGVNPMVTVMALARRVARSVLAEA
jgi:choline dehydrogenase-like flavoprotein